MTAQKNRWHYGGAVDLGGLNVSLRRLDVVLNDKVVYADDLSTVFTDPITFSSNVTIGGALSVSAATTLKGALSVAGATTLGSTLTVSAGSTLLGTLSVGGATILSNNLTVGGTLSVSAAATLKSTLSVGSTVVAGGNITIAKTSPVYFANDTGAASDAATIAYISFQRSAIEKGWVGFGDGSGSIYRIKNNIGPLYLSNDTQTITMVGAAFSPVSAGGLTLGTASLPWGAGFIKANESLRCIDDAAFISFYNTAGTTRSGFVQGRSASSFVLGTDIAQPIDFYVNGAVRWEISTSGHLLAFADNTYDIGAAGATRPRDYFGAGKITLGGNLVFGAAASKIIPGATSLSHRNTADSADNLLIADGGTVTVRTDVRAPVHRSSDTATSGGGVAGFITYTAYANLNTNSTGVGTILFKDGNNRDSVGFLRIVIDTTDYYIPIFAATG